MLPKILVRIVTLLCAWFLLVGPNTYVVHAQSQPSDSATLTGIIIDTHTLRAVQGAIARLIDNGIEQQRLTTDTTGRYSFNSPSHGVFTVQIEVEGYNSAADQNVRAVVGKVTVTDFALTPASSNFEEITVTGAAIGADPFAAVTATRISREDIRTAPGTGGDIFRGLDSLPGVISTGEFSNFTVRGRGPRDNLILIDGIPFDKVVHFDQTLGEDEDIGGGGRFSIFAPNIIGGASFEPGGWTAAYSGRNGSLLQLDIAEGNPISPTVSARLDLAGGELTYDGPSYFADNTSILLSARYFDFGNVFKLIGQDDLGDPEVSDVIFKSVTNLSDDHTVEFLAIYSSENFVRDIENVLNSPDFEDSDLLRSEQDSLLLGGTWTWLVGQTGQLTNAVFLRDSDKTNGQGETFPDLASPEPTAQTIPIREDVLTIQENEHELGWRSDFSIETGMGLLSMGVRLSRIKLDFDTRLSGDFNVYVYDQNDFRPDPSQKFVVLTPVRFNSAYSTSETRYAAYLDHAFTLGNVTLRPGIRFDRDGFSNQSVWSPRLSTTWQAMPKTQFSATAGVYFQQPRFLDLTSDSANNKLKSERTDQVSLGLEHFIRTAGRFSAEVYYQDLKDLVVLGDATSGLANNDGNGHATGIDISLERRMIDTWSALMTYSYSRSRRNDNDGTLAYNADFNRPHSFTFGSAWEPNDRWSVAAKWKYASGRPTDTFIINENVFNDPNFVRFSKELTANNIDRLPDYHSLNIRIDYRRRVGNVSLVTFLDIINAYGRNNISSLEWDERRGVNVIGDFGVFPQIGLKLEF